jgi:hypothetical protein
MAAVVTISAGYVMEDYDAVSGLEVAHPVPNCGDYA